MLILDVVGSFFFTRRGIKRLPKLSLTMSLPLTGTASSVVVVSAWAPVVPARGDGVGGACVESSCCEEENVTEEMAIVITSSSFGLATAGASSCVNSTSSSKVLKFSSILLITSSFSSNFSVMLSVAATDLPSSLVEVSEVSSINSISILVVEMSPSPFFPSSS
uniref:(northern house mosquito) hypothetical protein n=1 Tax=Culex pipiens TaxID=7175 RepID=A0A8D8P1V6_CULPI